MRAYRIQQGFKNLAMKMLILFTVFIRNILRDTDRMSVALFHAWVCDNKQGSP